MKSQSLFTLMAGASHLWLSRKCRTEIFVKRGRSSFLNKPNTFMVEKRYVSQTKSETSAAGKSDLSKNTRIEIETDLA